MGSISSSFRNYFKFNGVRNLISEKFIAHSFNLHAAFHIRINDLMHCLTSSLVTILKHMGMTFFETVLTCRTMLLFLLHVI